MRKIGVLVLAAATAMVLAVGGGSAVAANPEQDCLAMDEGFVFVKDPPNNQCISPGDPPGMNQGGVVKDVETTSRPGKSEPNTEEEACDVVNNGGSHNCTTG